MKKILTAMITIFMVTVVTQTSIVLAEESIQYGACEMTIKSTNTFNSPSNATGDCKGLVFGFYSQEQDTFRTYGMTNYDVEYSGQEFEMGTPAGKHPQAILTVYTVKVEPKPEPKPEPKEETKPKPTQPKEESKPNPTQPKEETKNEQANEKSKQETISNSIPKVESSKEVAVNEKSESTNQVPNKQSKETNNNDNGNQEEGESESVDEDKEEDKGDEIEQDNEESIVLSDFQKRTTAEKINPFEERSFALDKPKNEEKVNSVQVENKASYTVTLLISVGLAIILVIVGGFYWYRKGKQN